MRRWTISKNGYRMRKLNRRRAIRHHCRVCCDFECSRVAACEKTECPLHAYRLGDLEGKGLSPEERANAIRRFCSGCDLDPDAGTGCDAEECSLFPYRMG